MLLKIYAKCLDGQDAIARRRIEEALGDPGPDTSTPPQPRQAAPDDSEDEGKVD